MKTTTQPKNKKMETFVMTVTPEMAESLLVFNVPPTQHCNGNSQRPIKQRILRKSNIENFAKLIKQGEFRLTHQGIAFMGDMVNPKRLLDGQHRLHAIVKTGIPVKMMVSWNCPEELFSAIDTGASRTFRDRYGWNNKQVSIVKSISEIASLSGLTKMSKTDADAVMASFGKQISMLIDRAGTNRKGIATAPTQAAVVILMKQYPNQADDILNAYKYLTNERLDMLNPIQQRLYTKLIRIEGGGGNVWAERFLLTIKALDPKNKDCQKLVSYKDKKAKMATVSEFVKSQIGV